MALGIEVSLGSRHIVLDGDPAPPPKKIWRIYCGQMAVCIRIPLGMEVGLGLGDIVLDEDPSPPPLKWHNPPIFGQCLLWPNGWTDYNGTWYGGRPQPR